MGNGIFTGWSSRTVRNLSFGALLLLLVAVTTLALMTHNPGVGMTNSYWMYAVQHHTELMVGLIIISLVLGFVTSQFFYEEIQRKRRASQDVMGVVLLFLSKEERQIVNYLVRENGETTQAEIARLPHMNRVRAHRSLQKMQEKQILEVVPHGKVRRVVLKPNILELLQ